MLYWQPGNEKCAGIYSPKPCCRFSPRSLCHAAGFGEITGRYNILQDRHIHISPHFSTRLCKTQLDKDKIETSPFLHVGTTDTSPPAAGCTAQKISTTRTTANLKSYNKKMAYKREFLCSRRAWKISRGHKKIHPRHFNDGQACGILKMSLSFLSLSLLLLAIKKNVCFYSDYATCTILSAASSRYRKTSLMFSFTCLWTALSWPRWPFRMFMPRYKELRL